MSFEDDTEDIGGGVRDSEKGREPREIVGPDVEVDPRDLEALAT